MRESAIQKAILELLAYRGIYARRIMALGVPDPARAGGFRTSPMVGVADIIGVLPGGRFLAIEVKVPGGRATPKQLEFLERVNEKGGLAFVARSTRDVEVALDQKG